MAFGLDLGNLLVHLRADDSQYNKVMRSVVGVMKSGVAQLEKYARRAAIVSAAGYVASVRYYAKFNLAMTESLAIMGEISPTMRKQMTETALAISTQGITSAEDLAKAYFYLASAGLSAAQSVASLSTVQQFAQAGSFNMALATDLATDAQSALGLTVKDAQKNMTNMKRVTDVLTGANTLANATTMQFSQALTSKAGPAMKAFNINLEEGVAVLAAYADQGIKAEEAGNMFSRMLLLMSKGFRANEHAWRNFGINIYTATGALKPLWEIIDDLTEVLDVMSVKERTAALDMMGFQARSQQAILPLLGLGSRIKEYNDKLEKMNGITKEVADKQMKSFINQLKLLKNKIVEVAIVIGEKLAPDLEAMNKWFAKNKIAIMDWANSFADRVIFVKDVLFDFIKLLRTDFNQEFQNILKIMIGLFKVAAITLIDLAKRTGAGMAKAIMAGITGDKLNEMEIASRVTKLYKAAGGNIRIERASPSEEMAGILPTSIATDIELWNKLKEKVISDHEGRFVESVFKGFPEDAKKRLDSFMADFEGSMTQSGNIIDRHWKTLKGKDALREMATSWEEIKAAMMPVVDVFNQFIEAQKTVLGMYKEIKVVAVDTAKEVNNAWEDAWEDMKGGLSRWGEQAEKIWVNFGDAAGKAFDGIGDNLAEMLMGGEVDWKAFARSFIKELIAMIIKMQMAAALKAVIGGGWGGTGYGITAMAGAGAETPEFADGGIAWTPQLAKVGEKEPELITPFSKLKSLMGGDVIVNVHDENKSQIEIEENSYSDQRVIDVFITKLSTDGSLRKAVKGAVK